MLASDAGVIPTSFYVDIHVGSDWEIIKEGLTNKLLQEANPDLDTTLGEDKYFYQDNNGKGFPRVGTLTLYQDDTANERSLLVAKAKANYENTVEIEVTKTDADDTLGITFLERPKPLPGRKPTLIRLFKSLPKTTMKTL